MARNQRKIHGGPPSQSPEQQVVTQTTTATKWEGPLPPPAALEHFDRIIPGGAARILAMAEEQQAHRIEFGKKALTATIADKRRGQWMGWTVAIAAVAGAIWTAENGAAWHVSVALVSVPVLGIVKALISGQGSGKSEVGL